MLKIQLAQSHDAAIIALLARITFGETFGHFFHDKQELFDYYQQTFSVEKLNASIKKSSTVYWLAYVDQLPVGYAKLKLNSVNEYSEHVTAFAANKVCQLQKIYVLRDFLSMKIGHALQEKMLTEASVRGYQSIWLSVLHSNERAMMFYQKHGFIRDATHTFRIGSVDFDFITMQMSL